LNEKYRRRESAALHQLRGTVDPQPASVDGRPAGLNRHDARALRSRPKCVARRHHMLREERAVVNEKESHRPRPIGQIGGIVRKLAAPWLPLLPCSVNLDAEPSACQRRHAPGCPRSVGIPAPQTSANPPPGGHSRRRPRGSAVVPSRRAVWFRDGGAPVGRSRHRVGPGTTATGGGSHRVARAQRLPNLRRRQPKRLTIR